MYIQRYRSENPLSSWTASTYSWNNQDSEAPKEVSCNLMLYSYEYH